MHSMKLASLQPHYSALFIDVDNTLLTFRPSSETALKKTFLAQGMNYESEYFEVFFWIGEVLWSQQKKELISVQEIHDQIFPRLLQAIGVQGDSQEMTRLFHLLLHEEAVLEPGVAETLDYLSQRYRLYVASNGLVEMQRSRLKKAGILDYFSDLFVSDDIGAEKPSETFFLEAMRRSNTQPSDVLFIGDSISADMTGAARVAMDRCWYNRLGNPVPEALPLNHVINHLGELKSFL
ncbi:YjjG family noncanonical pyrimidine nucleotidase [uncultured Porphyromonas sp.]|uniref:YjjG family noncanonical pyrimidine nucleotidase n=1 Tax=uncultured Porphyromonas sp. TaxID=159274 RepID=UPI002638A1A4|nr:YjjG family noncanonical pyrimidine nucleotidase [uncultured Porphyromonas sp.]